MTYKEFKHKTEREFILRALLKNDWNKQKTAHELKIQRSHIYNLIDTYKILKSDYPTENFWGFNSPPRIFEEKFEIGDFANEKWKLLLENKNYFISTCGRIKDRNGFFKKGSISHGYEIVNIELNGVKTSKAIHILVAKTFIDNPEKKLQVNHINGVRNDNRVENLEWVTASENIIHQKLLIALSI